MSEKTETLYVDWKKRIPSNFTGLAIYPDGVREYYVYGKLHREDGPAIEYPYIFSGSHIFGGGSKHWCLDGKVLTFEKYWEIQKDTEYAPKIMAYVLGAKGENET